MIRGSIYAEVVEMMGGRRQGSEITRDECYKQLTSLSDREYLCGAYWMFKILFPEAKETLNELSFAQSKEAMRKIIEAHVKSPCSSGDRAVDSESTGRRFDSCQGH